MKQSGNALFLILIAVALFAALSYAVTQSGRGGGSIDREQAQIDASQLTQMAATVQQAYTKMKVLKGLTASEIVFCDADDSECDNLGIIEDFCTTGTNCLFAEEGGGLTNLNVPNGYSLFMYKFTDGDSLAGNGTSAPDSFMSIFDDLGSDLPEPVCQAVNVGLGLGSTIVKETDGDAEYGETLSVEGEPGFCMNASHLAFDAHIYFEILEAF